jgi:glycerate kinase
MIVRPAPVQHLLIAPDKFKGTLTASQAAEAISRGLKRCRSDWCTTLFPIADGGEGTTDMLLAANNAFTRATLPTLDPLLRSRNAEVAISGDTAVFESAAAIGLSYLQAEHRDPWKASSRGVGALLMSTIERGAKRILIGLGGSATNDGGLGMAAALGWRFLDAHGRDIEPLPANFTSIRKVVRPEGPIGADVIGLCDVTNPLLGEKGASCVFGPQKGLRDPLALDFALKQMADLVSAETGIDHREDKGAGAAGGLGYGLLTFCDATLTPGFDCIARLAGLEAIIQKSDVVLTGEGKIDRQTLFGKGPAELARMARRYGKPVAAFCGVVEQEVEWGDVFDRVLPITGAHLSLAKALAEPAKSLEDAAYAYATTINR